MEEPYDSIPYLEHMIGSCQRAGVIPIIIVGITETGDYKVIAPSLIRKYLKPHYRAAILVAIDEALTHLHETPLDDLGRI